jgi:4-hydroxy-tetrahydrodipicolinate reductase
VGASLAKFKGLSGGVPKIEVHLEWQMAPRTEPHWDVQGCYITTVEGDPTIVNRHMIFPATGMAHGAWTPEYFASVGMTITGMPAINAIPIVCEAKPGLMTSADLPLRAFAGRFADTSQSDSTSAQ